MVTSRRNSSWRRDGVQLEGRCICRLGAQEGQWRTQTIAGGLAKRCQTMPCEPLFVPTLDKTSDK